MWVYGSPLTEESGTFLPNGRYVEARRARENAYLGRYEVTGDHIEYWDDTGFTADSDFKDGVLYHAGMVLRRDPERGKARACKSQRPASPGQVARTASGRFSSGLGTA